MFRVLFLILVLMSSFVFAQTDNNNAQNDKPKGYILAEFNAETKDAKLQEIADLLMEKIAKEDIEGYIIIYGTEVGVRKAEKRLIKFLYDSRKHGTNRLHNLPLLRFVNGGNSGESKTVIWIVPEGAESPNP